MCFFFTGRGKKGLCADFLVHAAGPENLMIIFFGLSDKKQVSINKCHELILLIIFFYLLLIYIYNI